MDPAMTPHPGKSGNVRVTDTAPPERRRPELQAAMMPILLALYLSLALAVNYFGALHAPSPHHVRVAIVGPPAATAPVAHELSVAPAGGFDVSRLTSVATARRLIAERKLAGAYVPSPVRPTAIVATAASPSLAEFVAGVFQRAAARQDRPLAVEDMRPLPRGNTTGTPNLFFLIICTLIGFVTAAVSGVAARNVREWQRVAIVAAASVLAPTIAYLIGGLGFGAFTGSFGTIVAMVGMGALYTFVVATTARLMVLALGIPALLLAVLVLIFLNIPSSGGAVAPQLLPGFWRFISHFWIGAAAMDANRSILYFDGSGVLHDVLKLLAWLAAWGAILALPIYLRSTRLRRASAPRPAQVPQAA
jgi:Protein of unknown function (DUF3533)